MSDEVLRQVAEQLRETSRQQIATAEILNALAREVQGHQRTLYGEDGRDGLSGDMTVLRTTQEQCPARIAHEFGHRQSGVSNVVAIVGLGLATVTSITAIVIQLVLR
jgi:hypothetical protein